MTERVERIATFMPLITLDLDTKVVTIDFGSSLQNVSTEEYDDERLAGQIMDKILGVFPHTEPRDQAIVLRNLAQHIDDFTIQELP